MVRSKKRKLPLLISSVVAAFSLTATMPLAAFAASQQNNTADAFSAAAQEFGVPKSILLSVSYNESRWDSHQHTASVDGGYGVMNLTVAADASSDGRGDADRPVAKKATEAGTLAEAAKLLHTPASTLKTDTTQNIRGGAALLAQYAKDANNGSLPTNLADWYTAVAAYSNNSADMATDFADNVYATIQSGASRQTTDGQLISLTANKNLQPNKQLPNSIKVAPLASGMGSGQQNGTDCPSDLDCRFISAGYAANSDDPADYGNYDPANRPSDMKIKYLIIHDTEGSYESAIDHFQDTTSYVSANYVIRSSDGAVTEMVRPKDVSWGAGNWYVNMHAINIEHEGFANDGAGWYTEAMYQSSAKLIRYLAKKYDIPMDRQHILGHDEIVKPSKPSDSHWDPGAYWDWDHYMDLIQGKRQDAQSFAPFSSARTIEISPNFATNQPEVTDCSTGTCVPLPKQGANFVYLRTSPDANAPLLSNKYMHTDGTPGTTNHADWSAKATTGQRFVVAKNSGDWTGIWYDGKIGWFYNPAHKNAHGVASKTVSAKKDGVVVYGSAFPEASAYPADVSPAKMQELYALPKGQSYTLMDKKLPTDYFYDATINFSKPHDHEIFHGTEKFYQISFNHRIGYVKASDVTVKN